MRSAKIFVLLVLASLLSACGNAIDSVKSGTLQGLEQTTVGNAFDAYFKNPKWELKELPNKTQVVVFTGERDNQGDLYLRHDIYTVQFIIKTDGSFEVADPAIKVREYIDANGKTMEKKDTDRISVGNLLQRVYSGE